MAVNTCPEQVRQAHEEARLEGGRRRRLQRILHERCYLRTLQQRRPRRKQETHRLQCAVLHPRSACTPTGMSRLCQDPAYSRSVKLQTLGERCEH